MPRKNKHNNFKLRLEGEPFDSITESMRYWELLKSGLKPSEIVLQPVFRLIDTFTHETSNKRYTKPTDYFADFQYKKNGVLITEDVKGWPTDVYKLKIKLLLSMPEYKNICFVELPAKEVQQRNPVLYRTLSKNAKNNKKEYTIKDYDDIVGGE